jgi:hypothetical protein
MKLDLDIVLQDLKGRTFKWSDTDPTPMTLGDTLFAAVADVPRDKPLTGAQKRTRYRIAQLVSKKGVVEIDDADIAVIREECERFPVLVLGAIDAALGGPP